MAQVYDKATDLYKQAVDAFNGLDQKSQWAVGAVGGVAGLYLLKSVIKCASPSRPSAFELTGGSIAPENVAKEFLEYSASYGKGAGEGIVDRSKTVHLVDVFYSLVTDIYEWGWGQSFHFSPRLPGKNWKSSEAAHEARIAVVLGAKPGDKILDCGCGVGGPMRTIAAVSGANVVGITINEYQVARATHHNQKVILASMQLFALCLSLSARSLTLFRRQLQPAARSVGPGHCRSRRLHQHAL